MGWLQDRPGVVTSALFGAVAVHAVGALWCVPLRIWTPLTMDPGVNAAGGLYLGLAGGSAMAASFAGVVIIFGLDRQSEKFLKFRQVAGRSLSSNWMSVIASSFSSAALSLAAAVIVALGHPDVAPWLFELSALLVVHAVLRMLWLLRTLMRVVKGEDDEKSRDQAKAPLSRLFG
jgi:hypothetical protein